MNRERMARLGVASDLTLFPAGAGMNRTYGAETQYSAMVATCSPQARG